ncbi:MAG: 4Fe-4S dicluster domain-containing protein, partial [Hyphomicrobiales bacterium]
MQTNFSPEQLANPAIAHSEQILRKCVHCGFCTATCPTYVELGDELDSPRGRIYLIKQMLEGGKPATKETVKHIDRCLSCLSCMSTCPSGVNYMHLVDHARAHIDRTYTRHLADRLIRQLLMYVLPDPKRFRLALNASKLGKPLAGVFNAIPGLQPIAAMLALAPASVPAKTPTWSPGVFAASSKCKGRVALLTGCAQPVLNPGINEATVDLLSRLGIEVVVARGAGCCGALTHHMGKEEVARRQARINVDAWMREIE